MTDWLSALRTADLGAVASACGVAWTLRQGRALRCPACQREDAHHGPVSVDGQVWHCHACQAGGSGVDLLSWAALGTAPGGRWAELRAAAQARGLVGEDSGRTAVHAGSRRPPVVPADEAYPPRSEVEALWASARPVDSDREASTWCHRRFPMEGAHRAVAALDACRVLPLGAACPDWAGLQPEGRALVPWSATHRLLFAMWDSRGVMRGLRARSLNPNSPLKALPPRGYSARGLAMLDPVATSHLPGSGMSRVLIAEGEPQFLRAAVDSHLHGRAVIGVVSGSWSANHHGAAWAGRVAVGADVLLMTDWDDSGDRYAAEIASTMPGRRVERWLPSR